MPRLRTPEQQAIRDLDVQLTANLRAMESRVITIASRIRNQNLTIPALHGIIGGKNNKYVDSVRTQFSNPDDFLALWIHGLLKSRGDAARSLVQLLHDPHVFNYTRIFLMRNFYRHDGPGPGGRGGGAVRLARRLLEIPLLCWTFVKVLWATRQDQPEDYDE